MGLRLGLVPPPPRPARSAHTPSCHLAALLGHPAPLLWRQLWGGCSWVIIANIHPASCPPQRAGERAVRARAAPPREPGGRTLAWHGARQGMEGRECAGSRSGRAAGPSRGRRTAGRETRTRASAAHLWPALGADQPARNLFFSSCNRTHHTQNQPESLLCSSGIFPWPFFGQREPTVTGLGYALSPRDRPPRRGGPPGAPLWAPPRPQH